MKEDKGPLFTLSGNTITTRDGFKGTVRKEGNSYLVDITIGPTGDKRREGLAKRMADWYYNTQVKKARV